MNMQSNPPNTFVGLLLVKMIKTQQPNVVIEALLTMFSIHLNSDLSIHLNKIGNPILAIEQGKTDTRGSNSYAE